MSKKKSSVAIIVKIILLVLAALMVVSIFTDLVTFKNDPVVGDKYSTHITGQDTFETMFEGHEEGEVKEEGKNRLKLIATSNDDEHKFIVVMLEICFVVAVIAGIGCLVLSLLSLLGINLGFLNKIFALVFMLGALLTFIFALVVANVWQKEATTSLLEINGMPGVGAWFALVCGLGYGATYIATSRK